MKLGLLVYCFIGLKEKPVAAQLILPALCVFSEIQVFFWFFKKIYLFILYLFLAALGLCCCTWAFSSCGEWELLFVAVRGLLTAVASLVAEHWL